MEDRALAQARGARWRPDRPVTSIAEAARYVDRLGFALLFPTDRADAPALYEAVAGEDAVPFERGMGPAESAVWTWKDELPAAGLAWYGKLLYGRASLLAPALLRALYPGAGEPDDHEAIELPAEAHRIAEALMTGPLSSAALREIIGDRHRYDRAVSTLHRNLLVTSAGVQEHRSGWPAVVLELTCRLFDVGGGPDRRYATQRFLDTMVEAAPARLARAYGWPVAEARAELAALG
jgi:hypothetical protein